MIRERDNWTCFTSGMKIEPKVKDERGVSMAFYVHAGHGEIRGGEAFDLLQILNTGRIGTISTVDANSATQGISHFTTFVLESGIEMPYAAIRSNIEEALHIVVHMEHRPGQRFIREVLEVGGFGSQNDRYNLNSVYEVLTGDIVPRHLVTSTASPVIEL